MDMDLSDLGIVATTSDSRTLEQKITRIIRKMLLTALTYSDRKAEEIYMYFQLHPEGRAVLECLFKLGDDYFELSELNNSELEHEFDVSEEKQLQLMGYMSQGVTEFAELFENTTRMLPNEIWGWVNVEEGEVRSRLGWPVNGLHRDENPSLPHPKEVIRQWRHDLKTLTENFEQWLTNPSMVENTEKYN